MTRYERQLCGFRCFFVAAGVCRLSPSLPAPGLDGTRVGPTFVVTAKRALFTAFCWVIFALSGLLLDDVAAAHHASEPVLSDVLAGLHDPRGWKVHRRATKEGVAIFKKDLAGFDVPAFQGEKVVAVSSNLLFDLLVDFNAHAGLSTRIPLVISQELKRQGNVVDFFQLIDTPAWTMARDRCWFNRAKIYRNYRDEQGRHLQTWETLSPDHYPEYWQSILQHYPRALHLPFSMGSWEVIPLGPRSTRLIYRVITDPGGRIPANLREFVTGKTLPNNLLLFEEAASERAAD